MKKLLFPLLAIVLALGLALPMATPAAANPSWGDTLTEDTTLESDLSGSGTALIIGADDITVDLNGYTLSGNSTGYGIDNTGGYDGVTIKDGTIHNFAQSIKANNVSSFTLKDLTFTGDTGGAHAHVIDIRDGDNVVIKDVTITVGAGSPWWAEAIRLKSINPVEVVNVEVNGGWIGVNFALDTVGDPPTNGVVKESTFSNNTFIGIFLASTTDAQVTENIVTGGGPGWGPGGPFYWGAGICVGYGPVNIIGVTLSENEVVGNADGIVLIDADNSVVSENTVLNNGDWGIGLASGSTGNEIKENTATGNGGVDLIHTASSTPNTWDENTYGTKSGTDIP